LIFTGFDDCEAAPLIGLTTVHVPLYDMGYEAAKMAQEALDKGMTDKHIVMPSRLVIRESCGGAVDA
jgi:DNA-binding LacI/PurR family transcriptional regulator